jgi:hypothetical protein
MVDPTAFHGLFVEFTSPRYIDFCFLSIGTCFLRHVPGKPQGMAAWTFMTHYMQALLCIAREPGIRIRDIASELEITERSAHRIVSELVAEGYLTRHKVGARNFYEVHPGRPLRREAEGEATVGDVLAPLLSRSRSPVGGGSG